MGALIRYRFTWFSLAWFPLHGLISIFSPARQSEVQSVASMDLERRRHGYISDEQTISSSMSYGGLLTGGKKPKPVPPRKPSFLYLNRASSLQSVNGGVVKTNSMDRSSNKTEAKAKHSETESWNNNTAPKNSLRTALSGNLKWNILSSSRAKNTGSNREVPRDWCLPEKTHNFITECSVQKIWCLAHIKDSDESDTNNVFF